MQTWLVAGPVPVSADSAKPDNSEQEKVFKTDIISRLEINPDKAVPSLSANQKDFKWQVVSPATDVINLDDFYQGKDFAYAYALAEIKATAPATNAGCGK